MNPQDQGYQAPQNPGFPGQPQPPQPQQSASKPNPLAVMQPGEQVICEIKRHPIGLLSVYVLSGILLVGLAGAVFGLAPQFITSTSISQNQILDIGALIFFVVAILVFGFVYVANKVYWGNRWVVTSDSITQVSQTSLFDKQSSQLSLGNLEDVTVEQDGPLQHMYNFGLLRVETAGERSKFVFMFCPNPNYYARCILDARERFEQGRRGGDDQRLYREQGVYQGPPAQPAPGQYGQYGQPQPPQGNPQPYQQPPTNPMPPYYGGGEGQDNGININTQQ